MNSSNNKLTKKTSSLDKITKEYQKRVLLAVVITIFGIILFIALALTLPLNDK